jgi:DNA adenine methylase
MFVLKEPYTRSSDHVQSPFRYPGGKYYALKFILPFLHAVPHDEYREPFVGGGSVFFGKRKSKYTWLNDLECDLIKTYRVISIEDQKNWLVGKISEEVATRERHAVLKGFVPSNDLETAFKTYYLNRTSYSGILNKPAWGYAIGNSSPPENWYRFLDNARPKLEGVKLTSLDFEEIICAPSKGGNVLMYLDPPYYLADQKRAYTKSFVLEDHLRLCELLKNTDYKFCLSYDDCQQVRDLYKWANIYERSWFYNTANSSGPRKIGNELIITNFEAVHPEQYQLL